MQISTYDIQCVFTSTAFIPGFKGSALRGGFGHALKKVCCALKQQDCQHCLLASSCAYSYIFETHKYEQGSSHKLMANRPQPYVLLPFAQTDKFAIGELFPCKLLLFGKRANEMMPYVIYALKQIGETGLGRQKKQGAGRFTIQHINQNGVTIFSSEDSQLKPTSPSSLSFFSKPQQTPCTNLKIQCKTPLRMKSSGHFIKTMTFQKLIRGALRRLSALEECYGKGYPELDYKGIIHRAGNISIDNDTLHWQEQKRYSNRQKQGMIFGGLVGSITFKGDLTEFIPYLQYIAKVHLGKQTAFGLGEISLT